MALKPNLNSWNDYTVRGTNSAADNAEFAKAVALMNARGKGNILIDGTVRLTATHYFTKPIGLIGLPGSSIVMAGALAAIIYGDSTKPWDLTSYACDQITAQTSGNNNESWVVPTGLTLAPNDYVIVYGSNVLSGMSPHNPNTKYLPMEIHRVSRADLAFPTRYLLGDYFDDPISNVTWTVGAETVTLSTPRITKFTPIKGVRVRNLTITCDPAAASSRINLQFRYCADVEVQDCLFAYPSGGNMSFEMCYGVRVFGCRLEDIVDVNDNMAGDTPIYGVLASITNDFQMINCVTNAVRHGFTTGGLNRQYNWTANEKVVTGEYRVHGGRSYEATTTGTTTSTPPTHSNGSTETSGLGVGWKDLGSSAGNGYYRYGTVKNALISGCEFRTNGQQDKTSPYAWHGNAQCDTHSEGRRITIESNTFTVPGESNNIGVLVRSRDSIIRNNTFNCHKFGIPFIVSGPDATIEGNTFNGGYTSYVTTTYVFGGTVDRCRILRNTFNNQWGPAVQIENGTGHQIRGNNFTNCCWGYTSGLPLQTVIHIKSLTNSSSKVSITENSIPKSTGLAAYPNDYALTWGSTVTDENIEFSSNSCEGYGDQNIGLRTPMWTAGETTYFGYSRRWNGREYRNYVGTSLSVTAPVHASGDVSPWRFVRNYSGEQIADLESRQAYASGRHRTVVVHVPNHGLSILSQRGFPLTSAMNGIYDDMTAPGNTDCRILLDVIDTDYIVVADPGELVELPASLTSETTSPATFGRVLYWDRSASKYVATRPGDSDANAPKVLSVNFMNTSIMQARILTNASY
jgi:hypothetical protein